MILIECGELTKSIQMHCSSATNEAARCRDSESTVNKICFLLSSIFHYFFSANISDRFTNVNFMKHAGQIFQGRCSFFKRWPQTTLATSLSHPEIVSVLLLHTNDFKISMFKAAMTVYFIHYYAV